MRISTEFTIDTDAIADVVAESHALQDVIRQIVTEELPDLDDYVRDYNMDDHVKDALDSLCLPTSDYKFTEEVEDVLREHGLLRQSAPSTDSQARIEALEARLDALEAQAPAPQPEPVSEPEAQPEAQPEAPQPEVADDDRYVVILAASDVSDGCTIMGPCCWGEGAVPGHESVEFTTSAGTGTWPAWPTASQAAQVMSYAHYGDCLYVVAKVGDVRRYWESQGYKQNAA